MKNEALPRLGTFFLLLGAIILILFIASILGNDINLKYLLISSASFFLGYLLRRLRIKSEPTRFSSIRKVQNRTRQIREDKQARKDRTDDKTNPPFSGNF